MARTKKLVTNETHCLTPRQLEILTLIRDGRRSDGYSPTLQEIADELGISKITVFEHVEALHKKGLLSRRSNKARSLDLTASARLPDERPTLLPLVGRIAAGHPIEAIESPDNVDLEDMFTSRHPVGVLTVTGDSMIDEHIREGDLVIYERRIARCHRRGLMAARRRSEVLQGKTHPPAAGQQIRTDLRDRRGHSGRRHRRHPAVLATVFYHEGHEEHEESNRT